jgi:hypothetical protein
LPPKTSASPKGGTKSVGATECQTADEARRVRTTGRVANCVGKYSVNAEKNQSERRILSAFRRIFFEIFTRRRRFCANGVKCVNGARKAKAKKSALPLGEGTKTRLTRRFGDGV